MSYCAKPFEEFEIDVDGNCYCCCRWWNNSYCLGNIFTDSIEEIWNGEKAQELRRTILDGTYKYCNLSVCLKYYTEGLNYSLVTDYPREISFCYDYTCTAQCVFCNDKIEKMSSEEALKWDEITETKLIPLIKNAQFVRLNMTGELFVSEHSKALVKRIAQLYPNIKFEIVSNGVFASKENFENLGIEDKIHSIKFSIPSLNEKTYKRMVRNGNFKKLCENLEYVAFLKNEKKICEFLLNFIVCSLNYKELPKYTQKAFDLGAEVDCIMLSKNNEQTVFLKNFDFYNVLDKKHPEYNSFIDIINSEEISKFSNLNINPQMKNLEKVSLVEQIKNLINYNIKRVVKYKKN